MDQTSQGQPPRMYKTINKNLGGGFKGFLFSPKFGEDMYFD